MYPRRLKNLATKKVHAAVFYGHAATPCGRFLDRLEVDLGPEFPPRWVVRYSAGSEIYDQVADDTEVSCGVCRRSIRRHP